MRVVAPVDGDRTTIVGLAEAVELGLWDYAAQREEFRPNPGWALPAARRLAAVEAVLSLEPDVFCSVPFGLCTASYALARTAGCTFLMLEAGTPVRIVRSHGHDMAPSAVTELAPAWLAAPGGPAATAVIPDEREMPLSAPLVKALVHRLRRIEGQARGVQRLVEEGRDRDTIMTQVAALRSAVNAVGMAVLMENLIQCLATSDGAADAYQSLERAKRAFQWLN